MLFNLPHTLGSMKVASLDYMPDDTPLSLVKIELHNKDGTVSWHNAWYEGVEKADGVLVCSKLLAKPKTLFNIVHEK